MEVRPLCQSRLQQKLVLNCTNETTGIIAQGHTKVACLGSALLPTRRQKQFEVFLA